jgi:RNA polymerase sigma-70 factor (ECF subfamily)
MEISDIEIGEGLCAGDLKTFEQIFFEYNRGMTAYAMKFVDDMETARDLVQDVFFYIWEKREVINIDRSLKSYLFRAVHNACINFLKKEEHKNNYGRELMLTFFNDFPKNNSDNAYQLLVAKDIGREIDIIIEKLPEQCRNIFKLSRFKGLKNREIAEIYSISTRTVETQIYRALKALKAGLQHYLTSFILAVTMVLFR